MEQNSRNQRNGQRRGKKGEYPETLRPERCKKSGVVKIVLQIGSPKQHREKTPALLPAPRIPRAFHSPSSVNLDNSLMQS